jgi:hypothetical protein
MVLSQPTNLGSRASYRHGGRSPLPTNYRKMPLIKALTGETPGTQSPTELWHWDQSNSDVIVPGLWYGRALLQSPHRTCCTVNSPYSLWDDHGALIPNWNWRMAECYYRQRTWSIQVHPFHDVDVRHDELETHNPHENHTFPRRNFQNVRNSSAT